MLRFIHITDTHIGPHKDFELYGIKPYPFLVKLVAEINALPFDFDFVLHTGDVVDDGGDASYRLAREVLSQLKAPIFYVAGNHDEPEAMRSVLLGQTLSDGKTDSTASIGGGQFLFLDSRGPKSAAGWLEEKQLAWLKEQCTTDGPPLVIVLHHSPLLLDTHWLDLGGKSWGGKTMLLGNHEEFRKTIAPAKNRIKGVFFGHVHGTFQIVQDGILYIAGPSGFAQLENWPHQAEVVLDRQPPGYNVVTVGDGSIIIRNRALI